MPTDIELPDVADSSSPSAGDVSSGGSSTVDSTSGGGGGDGGFSSPFEAFKSLPDFEGQDDLSIARSLYRAHNSAGEAQRQLAQFQNLMPATQHYLRNQDAFEKWQRAQVEAAAPKQPEAPKWWNPPQVKDTWRNFVIRDPQTGKEVISPDAPYEAQQALREYQTYTTDFARRLVTDPENTLKPFIEQVAQQKAQELVQGQFGQYAATNYVSDLERQHADWLYDQNGQVSSEGQAIQRYIADAAQLGAIYSTSGTPRCSRASQPSRHRRLLHRNLLRLSILSLPRTCSSCVSELPEPRTEVPVLPNPQRPEAVNRSTTVLWTNSRMME
jgi:hypothetical protein